MDSGTNNSSQANPNISIQTGHSQQVEPLIASNSGTTITVNKDKPSGKGNRGGLGKVRPERPKGQDDFEKIL